VVQKKKEKIAQRCFRNSSKVISKSLKIYFKSPGFMIFPTWVGITLTFPSLTCYFCFYPLLFVNFLCLLIEDILTSYLYRPDICYFNRFITFPSTSKYTSMVSFIFSISSSITDPCVSSWRLYNVSYVFFLSFFNDPRELPNPIILFPRGSIPPKRIYETCFSDFSTAFSPPLSLIMKIFIKSSKCLFFWRISTEILQGLFPQ